MSKAKVNYLYNVILTLSGYIINLAVFPYVSRVLGVEMMGRFGFVNNMVEYFTVFSLMGIGIIGVREIASSREGSDLRRNYSSLIGLLSVQTAISLIVYVVAILTIPRFAHDRTLFAIGSIGLLSSSFLLEWFYQGMENFRFITVRSLAVKLAYVVSIFIFVRKPDDYGLYFLLTVAVTSINALINILYSRRTVRFSLKDVSLKQFAKPDLSLGLYRIMVSMYTTFNLLYLGFVCTDIQTGYYFTATKIYAILFGLYMAMANVMMPRMSSLSTVEHKDEFSEYISKSFDVVLSTVIPIAAGIFVMAPQIVQLLSGDGYEGAILPLRLIMPVLVITSLAQIWVLQVLIPRKMDDCVLISAFAGAVVGVLVNVLLDRKIGAAGPAIAMLCSEAVGNGISLTYAIRRKLVSFPLRLAVKLVAYNIPVVAICFLSSRLINSAAIALLTAAFLSALYLLLTFRTVFGNTYTAGCLETFFGSIHHSRHDND